MDKLKLLPPEDLQRVIEFQKRLELLILEETFIVSVRKRLLAIFGASLKKTKGKGSVTFIFTTKGKEFHSDYALAINLSNVKEEKENRIALLKAIARFKNIKVLFENFNIYNDAQKTMLRKYIDQLHPEALILAP